MSRIGNLILATSLPVLLLGVVSVMCCLALVVGTVWTSLYNKLVIEPVYRDKLGIGISDKEVEAFMNRDLKGLTHSEVLDRLKQWGDVEVERYSEEEPSDGGCAIILPVS